MKVLGIVAEYNPFHNGHLYHLEESVRITGASHTVAVMSGNFMQRGEPSIVNKWARAETALKSGVDLVLELPVVYACSSAETFAIGAIGILDRIGAVDCLCFGSETGELNPLQQVSDILLHEPESLKAHLKNYLSKGVNFPVARALALEKYMGPSASNIHRLLKAPNNILAIEYLKALKRLQSTIIPYTIKRHAAGYHSSRIRRSIASASAIRSHLLKVKNKPELMERIMPDTTLDVLNREFAAGRGPIHTDLFSAIIISDIRRLGTQRLKGFPEVTEGLENRIWKAARKSTSISAMINQAKTKRYTHTRLKRVSVYIMLDMYKNLVAKLKHSNYPSYARVLGLNKKGREILKRANTLSKAPIITKTSNHSFEKDTLLLEILEKDILATDLYVLGYPNADHAFAGQDFVTSPLFL